jgi:hypothetical protein
VTEQQRKRRPAEPSPELPESGADLEPQPQPLTHHEPVDTHRHDHEPAVGDIPAEDHTAARDPADSHAAEDHTSAAISDHAPASARGDANAHGHVTADSHADAHGHADVHHEEPRVGPIDWPAWGYAALGVLVALVVVAAFWIAAY